MTAIKLGDYVEILRVPNRNDVNVAGMWGTVMSGVYTYDWYVKVQSPGGSRDPMDSLRSGWGENSSDLRLIDEHHPLWPEIVKRKLLGEL